MHIENHIDRNIFDGQFIHFNDGLIKQLYIKGCESSERIPCLLGEEIYFSWAPIYWESENLNKSVKRIDYVSPGTNTLRKLSKILKYMIDTDLLYMRLNKDHPLVPLMPENNLGFADYAGKKMLVCLLSAEHKCTHHPNVHLYDALLIGDKQKQLSQIAEKSFAANRFSRDKRFPPGFSNLVYKGLIQQYAENAENVLCFTENNQISGFLAYDICIEPISYGFIHLVAVTESARGRGIAGILIRALKRKLLENDIQILYANVDSENNQSLRCFLKNDFTQFNGLIEYHWWK